MSAAAAIDEAPRALVVTSVGAPAGAVVPILAALEAGGLKVRAIDAGRVGSRGDGLVEGVFRAIVGEFAERRLLRELTTNPPDVILALDPGSTQVLSVARDEAARPAPVVAIVAELDPDEAWSATDADRYLCADDEAAVALADLGVEAERIMVVGPVCEQAFVAAGATARTGVRQRYKLPASRAVVVVEVAGLGDETTSQLALQLSLVERDAVYLFDAGNDSDAAMLLRRQVPTLGLEAKLFGASGDRPLYWRCADIVVARPRPAAVARAIAVGARVVALSPEGNRGERLARALEVRGLGATAGSPLLVSSALESLLAKPGRADDRVGTDGAEAAADVARLVGADRHGVIDENRSSAHAQTRERVQAAASAADASARAGAPPGDLEDLGGGDGASFYDASEPSVPDRAEIARLRAELSTRMKQLTRSVTRARESADDWAKKAAAARKAGNVDDAARADGRAEDERARMHAHLEEMAEVESELRSLEKAERAAREAPPRTGAGSGAAGAAHRGQGGGGPRRPKPPPRASGPTVDEMLDRLKNQARTGGGTGTRTGGSRAASGSRSAPKSRSTVDDELEALKRKMAAKKKKS